MSELFKVLIVLHCVIQSQCKQLNVVFILTDDQDLTLHGMKYQEKTNKLIVENGLTFTNAFVSSPICCISRASILSGRYVHNHKTINNSYDGGCGSLYWQKEIEPYCFASYIKAEGYNTFYAGKYLNTYGQNGYENGGTQHIPSGWSQWFGLVGNSKYYNYTISANGVAVNYGDKYEEGDYYTNVIRRQSIDFLNKYVRHSTTPFFMLIAPPASHSLFTPEPRYENTAQKEIAPRIANWNNFDEAVVSNKHDLIRLHSSKMNEKAIKQSDDFWRMRHGTLQSVDDIVEDIYNMIDEFNMLQQTLFLYTSDHGFHIGQFGQGWDKRQLYENDIRVPFIVSGAGISKNMKTDIMALNIDIAPTLIQLMSNKENIPKHMDGRSLVQYLYDDRYHYNNDKDKNAYNIKQQFLIEYYGDNSYGRNDGIRFCDANLGPLNGWNNVCDAWNNSYDCIRMIDTYKGQNNGSIYCKFKCFDDNYKQIECEKGTAQYYGEFYDLDMDYYQLSNRMLSLAASEKQIYETMLEQFLLCKGQKECNQLREGNNFGNEMAIKKGDYILSLIIFIMVVMTVMVQYIAHLRYKQSVNNKSDNMRQTTIQSELKPFVPSNTEKPFKETSIINKKSS